MAKFLITFIRVKGKVAAGEILHWLTKSGGMPSGHTASFMALSVFLGLKNGFTADIFVLSICTTLIFIYDAVNVRRAVGEQGRLLNDVVKEGKATKKQLKVVEGHTVPEVIGGALLGIVVGMAVFLWTSAA